MNYSEANETLVGKRDRKKVANNTYLERRDDSTIALRLHDTDVLTFTPEWVEYNTGGWFTVTTKDRQSYGPCKVAMDKGKWLLFPMLESGLPDWDSGGWIYFDGIRVTNDGRKLVKTAHEYVDTAPIKRQIGAFVKLAAQALTDGLPVPNGGDCWGCYFAVQDGGDPMGTEHLQDHLDEGYVVPSLLWNAVKEAGYQYPEVILAVHENGDGYAMGGNHELGDLVSRALRKYLKKRLVPNETA